MLVAVPIGGADSATLNFLAANFVSLSRILISLLVRFILGAAGCADEASLARPSFAV